MVGSSARPATATAYDRPAQGADGLGEGVGLRAVMQTLAPSSTNRWAMAKPMPRLAPVTTATRPASLPSCEPMPLPRNRGEYMHLECMFFSPGVNWQAGPVRVLFASLGSVGHTYPLIPLAVAARDAGHEVHWAAGAEVHPPLAALGLRPFRPADAFYEIYAEDLAPELDRLRPDLVVHEWGLPGRPSPRTRPASPASGTASAA